MSGRSTLATPDARVVYVAAGRLAAAQWRCHFARRAAAEGRRALLGTSVVPYRAFAASLWEAHRAPGAPMLLSPRQTRALWRRVIAESPDAGLLLGTAGPAEWAEHTWRLAIAYGIPLERIAARGGGTDFGVFAGWARDYRARLRESGWIDDALLDDALGRAEAAPSAPIVLADLDPTPSQRALFARLEGRGARIDALSPPAVDGRAQTVRCADPAEELAAAAEWAAQAAAARPSACFAIVVPELGARGAEVRRVLEDALGSNAPPEARRILVAGERANVDERPLLGAALNALELFGRAGGFRELSRWLRSPFFHDEATRAAAAAFEGRLRDDPLAQVPFVEAYLRGGLRQRVRAALPSVAARLDAALDDLGPADRRRSPAAWAALWPRVLDRLGGASWLAARRAAAAEHELYEEALVELARLTPIVGTLSREEALAELETGMCRERPAPMPLAGVHVVAAVEDVGPGYAGVWVTGATDERLPRPVALSPFLPRDVQIAAGIPWCSPHDALARSRALLARIEARVPEAVYSWPGHVRDEPAEPSPLIRGLPTAPDADLPRAARPRGPARRRETVPDPAPAMAEPTVRGGTAALGAHAVCPLRAFCEHRLGARPLAPLARGVSPARRGRILHRALERFFRAFDSHAALERASPGLLDDALYREARRAATEAIGRGAPLLDALVDIETAHAAAALSAFVRRERERAPFRVASLELDETLEIRGKRLRVRIDRIDALESGGIAVIDYKTGSAPRPADWLGDRLRDVQLPVYAAAMPAGPLAALVAAVVQADGAAYAGLWEPADAFPGRSGWAGGAPRLADLVETWRERIGTLVDEYAAGDVRLFDDDVEPASGPYAPLTRLYALLAAAPADSAEAR